MIIKSLARKAPSFGQLVEYLNRSQSNDGFTVNCWASGDNFPKIIEEFEGNYKLLKVRSNGNAMYHEILALPYTAHVSISEQKEILTDLVHYYIKQRCPEQLVYVQIHTDDTPYVHAHLMISSNSLGKRTRYRLTTKEYEKVKVDTENYKLQKYGDLFPEIIHSRSSKKREGHKEYELKKRSGRQTKNDDIRASVYSCLHLANSIDDFNKALEKAGFTFYQRGKTMGVIHYETQKKYRLKTLGLVGEIERIRRLTELERLSNSVERDLSNSTIDR